MKILIRVNYEYLMEYFSIVYNSKNNTLEWDPSKDPIEGKEPKQEIFLILGDLVEADSANEKSEIALYSYKNGEVNEKPFYEQGRFYDHDFEYYLENDKRILLLQENHLAKIENAILKEYKNQTKPVADAVS